MWCFSLRSLRSPGDLGRSKKKVKFTSLLSKSSEINWLSAARLFSVCRPRRLVCGWSAGIPESTGMVLLCSRSIPGTLGDRLRPYPGERARDSAALRGGVKPLMAPPLACGPSCCSCPARTDCRATVRLSHPGPTLTVGLGVFALVFAINSAVHSYLVLAYTDEDSVALNVGFYYMANAGGRLLGTLLSGIVFQFGGFQGCLWGSAALVLAAAVLSLGLPRGHAVSFMAADVGGSE